MVIDSAKASSRRHASCLRSAVSARADLHVHDSAIADEKSIGTD